MKIIDLLNKIAKGEEVPKKIRIGIYNFYKCEKRTSEEDYDYQTEDGEYLINYLSEYEYITTYLNDEIEIIEEVEDKEYEDIEEVDSDGRFSRIINALIRNQKYILERLEKGE